MEGDNPTTSSANKRDRQLLCMEKTMHVTLTELTGVTCRQSGLFCR